MPKLSELFIGDERATSILTKGFLGDGNQDCVSTSRLMVALQIYKPHSVALFLFYQQTINELLNKLARPTCYILLDL